MASSTPPWVQRLPRLIGHWLFQMILSLLLLMNLVGLAFSFNHPVLAQIAFRLVTLVIIAWALSISVRVGNRQSRI